MKKVLLIIALCIFIGTIISSCKTTGHCPAYSKAKTEQNHQKI